MKSKNLFCLFIVFSMLVVAVSFGGYIRAKAQTYETLTLLDPFYVVPGDNYWLIPTSSEQFISLYAPAQYTADTYAAYIMAVYAYINPNSPIRTSSFY